MPYIGDRVDRYSKSETQYKKLSAAFSIISLYMGKCELRCPMMVYDA